MGANEVKKNRSRRVQLAHRFSDLNRSDAGPRITEALQQIVHEINVDRSVAQLGAPTGLTATAKPAAILLQWDALSESYRSSWDGARIWRVAFSDDPAMDFNANNKKAVIVTLVRATSFNDPVGNTGDQYTYWIQWVDANGDLSAASEGVTGQALWDAAAPGAVEDLSVTGANGVFKGSWRNPLTNINTLDGFAQQYSTSSTYSASETTTLWWGMIYHHEGVDPNQAYYFRYSAHNLSGDTLTNTDSALGSIFTGGWGPWTDAPLNPVSSGQLPGSGVDTVIPSILNNLEVWGSNGEFLASWEDPTYGNLGINDIAEEYSLSRTSWVRVESKTLRWGNTRFLRGSRPNTSYHFRFAAHNNSDTTSATAGPGGAGEAFAGETGWGPWTYYGPAGSTTSMAASITISSGQVSFATALTGARVIMSQAEGILGVNASDVTVFRLTTSYTGLEVSSVRGLSAYSQLGIFGGEQNVVISSGNESGSGFPQIDLDHSGQRCLVTIDDIQRLEIGQTYSSVYNSGLVMVHDGIYFGNPNSDGCFRITMSGDNLLFQQRESATWVTKSTISGA